MNTEKIYILVYASLPFCIVGLYFWFCLWNSAELTWDFRMYFAFLLSVFMNYFSIKPLNRTMETKAKRLSFLYVLLWEIIAPLVSIGLVFFSLVLENKLYNGEVLVNSNGMTSFYIAIAVVMIFLFLFFMRKGMRFFTNEKNIFRK